MAQSPTPFNVTLTSANTEYSQVLPADCRRWSMQCRTAYDVRFAFVTGKVAGSTAPFLTMKSGGNFDDQPLPGESVGTQTVYLASAQAGVVVEILCWS